MNVALWISQGLLAAVFLGSGRLKSTQSKAQMLATGQTGVQEYSLPFIRSIAAAELLGAAGMVVPWALQIAPVLTPLAALGLGIIMIGAARAHYRLHELSNVAKNLGLLALCGFVGIGRLV